MCKIERREAGPLKALSSVPVLVTVSHTHPENDDDEERRDTACGPSNKQGVLLLERSSTRVSFLLLIFRGDDDG
jgi:hypothetical protein